MAWNGLWWWRRIFETNSASFEGSMVGRLSEEKGRSSSWSWSWRERKRVGILVNAIDRVSLCVSLSLSHV